MARPFRSPVVRASAALFALAMVAGLAACDPGSSSDSDNGEALPPIMVDVAEVDGTTVQVPLDNVLVLAGDDDTFKAWSATIADPSIVEFVPGKDDGSAQFNPGLDPLAEGVTEVTLDNADSGDTLTFTVEVTPAG